VDRVGLAIDANDETWIRHPSVLLFIEGVVSISLQLVVIRQLVPFVGHSINVTSIVITAFLAALALGYWAGGRALRPAVQAYRNLIGLALSVPLIFSHPFLELFFNIGYGLSFPPLVVTTLYCLIFLMPVVYLLGQLVILLVNFRKVRGAAAKAGETFYLSTIGNVVGGLFTTLVVMYFLGMSAALAVMTGLICIGVLLCAGNRVNGVLVSALACSFAMVGWVYEGHSFTRTTAFANYYIAPDRDSLARVLVVNGQSASRTDDRGLGHAYIEWMEDRIELLESDSPLKVLVLGAGGFSLGEGRNLSVKWQFVDVDAHLESVGEMFLQQRLKPRTFVASDARAWLSETPEKYDVVVLDAFSHRTSVPDHLLTYEFFLLLRSRLNSEGHLLMNAIVADKPSRFARGLENTLRFVFAMCEVTRIGVGTTGFHNRLFECRRDPMDNYRNIYSDDNTKALFDGANR
jgi:spermidine synthase